MVNVPIMQQFLPNRMESDKGDFNSGPLDAVVALFRLALKDMNIFKESYFWIFVGLSICHQMKKLNLI